MNIIEDKDLAALLRERSPFSHKGDYGRALLVAGSRGMMGAAVLAARACLRSGAGLLTVHVPGCGYGVVQTAVPEAMCRVDDDETHLTSARPVGFDAVAVGPGLGQHPETAEALADLVVESRRPMVVDADALNLLAQRSDLLASLPACSILTPHPGEADRLLRGAGLAVGSKDGEEERLRQAIELATRYELIVVLKGTNTCVCEPDGSVWQNLRHGHPGMATGGTGDTLTGVLLGLLAQGYAPAEAARLGVGLHSLAADLALYERQSHESWLPSDLVAHLGAAFCCLRHLAGCEGQPSISV